ncbi:nuclear transport factor 2 family protein [Flagellimonas sp.]|uniref:nuclear transport factor 2 family protein n=1 Tax=Flagellimonas sp. TaxID=2058762 RepID=UPI003BAEC6EE
MKQTIFFYVLVFFSVASCQSQNAEVEQIKKTITEFSKAGDQQDATTLSQYLDPNFRIVMNQLFGHKEVMVISKADYLEKIKSKKWGGDTRTLTFGTIEVNGNVAFAKVILTGKKSTFHSLMLLVRNASGQWVLAEDVPTVK